jgi:hypothetical protein
LYPKRPEDDAGAEMLFGSNFQLFFLLGVRGRRIRDTVGGVIDGKTAVEAMPQFSRLWNVDCGRFLSRRKGRCESAGRFCCVRVSSAREPDKKGREMTLVAEQEMEKLGATRGIANHDHDLIHELSRRLDCMWRYDQYIANADWRDGIREFWEKLKMQEQENIAQLKELVRQEVQSDCF